MASYPPLQGLDGPKPSAANERQVDGDHYVNNPVQTWDYIHRNDIGYLAGNVIKYVSRYKGKHGLTDLYKARHYLEKLIEEELLGKVDDR
jgi:hypothetical protein